MQKFFTIKIAWAFIIYALLNTICIGMGMGIPIFCIFFGLPVGWYIARRITIQSYDTRQMLGKMLLGAVSCAVFTFIGMALLWGPTIRMLFDPAADLENFGIPMILYEPLASFIGWIVLMIVISPFLQLLISLFGSHLTILWWFARREGEKESDPGSA